MRSVANTGPCVGQAWVSVAASRKPNSVRLRRRLRAGFGGTIIPLALSSLTGSSDRPGDIRRAACGTPPYLVLLRAGFCLPPVLPQARCALTAPFHPYPLTNAFSRARAGRYIFCATILRVAPTGGYPAHCPAEFGLSSPIPARTRQRRRSSGSLRPAIVQRGSADF
jgi:hypothetical protein